MACFEANVFVQPAKVHATVGAFIVFVDFFVFLAFVVFFVLMTAPAVGTIDGVTVCCCCGGVCVDPKLKRTTTTHNLLWHNSQSFETVTVMLYSPGRLQLGGSWPLYHRFKGQRLVWVYLKCIMPKCLGYCGTSPNDRLIAAMLHFCNLLNDMKSSNDRAKRKMTDIVMHAM